jgi:DNA polymerase-3 subunit delta'
VSVSGEPQDTPNIPLPRANSALFGHSAAEQRLFSAYCGGRIPHAWLIGGPKGIGKATLAYRFARFVLANPDPSSPAVRAAGSLAIAADHPVARRIAGQAHTDLLVLERTAGDTGKLRTEISVADVRRNVAFFGSTAGEGGWRIAIVDCVEDLNVAGENALLKVLEEPPPRSLFLLVSQAPGSVRATLRSRCQKLLLRPLAKDDVARAAAAALGRDPTDPEIVAAAEASGGSVAHALRFADEDSLAFRRRVLALLERLPEMDLRELHALGDMMSGPGQGAFSALVDSVNEWLSSRLAGGRAEKHGMARVAETWEKVNLRATEAEIYNLERKSVIFSIFGLLAEAARG